MIITASKENENQRLDSFLSNYSELTRNKIQKLIEKGCVKVNGKLSKPSYKIQLNDEIEYIEENEEEKPLIKKEIPLDIVYEDDDLIVLNKQKDLICHPTAYERENTLVNALMFHTDNLSDIGGKQRAGIVHRLDKDTSGLMLAAKNNEVHIKLQQDIQSKKTIRKYLAVCHGIIKDETGIIDKPLIHNMGKTVKMNVSENGMNAITEYKVIERFQGATFLELNLLTGRTHQIRCHMSYINHPLIGDDLYGAGGYKTGIFQGLKVKGQVLMSYYLSFTHPSTGEIMSFEIKEENYHPDLIKVLKLLRSKN